MRKPALLLLLLLLFSPLAFGQNQSVTYMARFVVPDGNKTWDGDSFYIQRAGQLQHVKVRLKGPDAPEISQPGGPEAKEYVYRELIKKPFEVEEFGLDIFDRPLIVCKINLKLVETGNAWWSLAYAPDDIKMARAQARAMIARKGLWAQCNPIAPWEWRQGKRPGDE